MSQVFDNASGNLPRPALPPPRPVEAVQAQENRRRPEQDPSLDLNRAIEVLRQYLMSVNRASLVVKPEGVQAIPQTRLSQPRVPRVVDSYDAKVVGADQYGFPEPYAGAGRGRVGGVDEGTSAGRRPFASEDPRNFKFHDVDDENASEAKEARDLERSTPPRPVPPLVGLPSPEGAAPVQAAQISAGGGSAPLRGGGGSSAAGWSYRDAAPPQTARSGQPRLRELRSVLDLIKPRLTVLDSQVSTARASR